MTAVSPREDLLPVLAPLAHLARARSSAAEYYRPLSSDDDEVLRVAAFYAMLSRHELPFDLFQGAVDLSIHGAVRGVAFDFFQSEWEHTLAAAVAAQSAESETIAEVESMLAEIGADDLARAAAHRRHYLATGEADNLLQEEYYTYVGAGPAAALPIAVRNVVSNPHEPKGALLLIQRCAEMADVPLLDALIDEFSAVGLHAYTCWLYKASSFLLKGDPRAAIAQLDTRPPPPPNSPEIINRLRSVAAGVRAQALDKLGDYPAAYRSYVEMNRPSPGETLDTTTYRSSAAGAGSLPVPTLPTDPSQNWFVMTGFARSGTTLLENALAAHPAVETFEERLIRPVVMNYLGRSLPRAKTEGDRHALFLAARERYYAELSRYSRKAGARVHIDKQPMRSTDARFNAKLFPEKRHIFSIRHPFDVVLSCFRQDFTRNIAMDNFRTFEGAASLYDFSMGEWFASYSLSDPRVHYLRYDDLVTDFETSLRNVLHFLGVDWDDAVTAFAASAQDRATKTPSYRKVRQGLSIGVQTSWRNYRFLFETPAARPLYKWAEFFGYDTK